MAGIIPVGAVGSLVGPGMAPASLGGPPLTTGGSAGTSVTGGIDPTGGSGAPNSQDPGGSFVDSLGQALNDLNTQLTSANDAMASFAAGTSSADLGTVMLQMQEASLDLNLGTQVRNGLLDAYRQIMSLQV